VAAAIDACVFHEATQIDKVNSLSTSVVEKDCTAQGGISCLMNVCQSISYLSLLLPLPQALYNRLVPLSGGQRMFFPIQINRLKVKTSEQRTAHWMTIG
jgi:hypothetical protein